MLPHILQITGLLLLSSAALKAADKPTPGEDIKTFVDLRTRALNTKLHVFENKMKYLLKYNMSENDVEKFRKYISMSITGIENELTDIQNYTNLISHQSKENSWLPIWGLEGKQTDSSQVLFKACEHIVESNECYKREQNKKEIKNLLRLADRLINIQTRFTFYKTLYKDMTENKYDNIYNLNSFLHNLNHHFIINDFNPKNVMEDAQYIKGKIKNTYKKNASEEIREELFSDCQSAEVMDSFWELTVMVHEVNEFSNVLEAVMNANCDYNCITALLNTGRHSKSTHVTCQIVKHVYEKNKMEGNLYDTQLKFKLAQLIAHTTHRRNYLEDVEPCFDVRDKLHPSTKQIIFHHSGCIENQLYKGYMFTKLGFDYDKANTMVFVTANDGNRKNAQWNFESDGLNVFWFRHKNSGKYLYSSKLPFNAANMQADATNVFTSKSGERTSRWHFRLVPESGDVRILNEEMRYLYATDIVVKGEGKQRLVAV